MAFDVDESMAVLATTPHVLRAWLGPLPAAWLEVNEGPETWSARDILGHFIHGEDTDWITRARMILEGAKEPFPPFDRFAQFRRFADTPVPELLDLFARSRRDNLATLAGWRLGPAELALPGTHPSFGPVTLSELLATWVVHDLNHIGQIARVMAKRYGDVVGPWKEYLPILSR